MVANREISSTLWAGSQPQPTIMSLMNMRTRLRFNLLTLTILVISCNDERVDIEQRPFFPGDVIVGIKSSISIDMVFELMNEKGVLMDQMSGFYSYSLLPNDSLTFINNQLIAKSYLDKRGWSNQGGKIVNNRIQVITFFFEMDLESQLDWLETIENLQLKDLRAETKNLLIKVRPGTEKEWVRIFKSHPYVKWAELNEYAQLELLKTGT